MDHITLEKICSKIEDETSIRCETYNEILNDATICIPSDQLRSVIDVLRDEFDYYHLTAITAQQREGQPDDIEILYHFWKGEGLSLLVTLPAKSRKITSIVSMIPGADFYEREAAELFGIEFTGRKETLPLLLPDDWTKGPPLLTNEENDE